MADDYSSCDRANGAGPVERTAVAQRSLLAPKYTGGANDAGYTLLPVAVIGWVHKNCVSREFGCKKTLLLRWQRWLDIADAQRKPPRASE